ncbi:MAG: DUF3179 domain-containing protein [Anaerolineae bacterium]|nr:DUF3179 domain-containing protein [Anaerolineae bacterium]
MDTTLKTFDVGRAVLEDYLDTSLYPARLMVSEAQSLADAVRAGSLPPDARMLTFEHDGVLYTFPMSVVLSYNVIQGAIHDKPWMMTFCNACNTGMVFDPVVDGQMLHFKRRGSYDGLLLIWDEETDTYWQHITGEGLHGSSAGKQLNMITTTRQMTAAEALAINGGARLLTTSLTEAQQTLSGMMEKMRSKPERVEAGIVATIAEEDKRRPRFELGLGVWSGHGETSTFFPLVMLHMHDNALLTEFDGRRLLMYQVEGAIAPVAAYVDARPIGWQDEVLRLDNGALIKYDVLYAADGSTHALDRPMQLLMRWYGFALTFPGCDVPNF